MRLALALLVALLPFAAPAAERFAVSTAAIEAAVTAAQRSAEDRDRDPLSLPAATLELIGIAPGMRVLDMNAAAGYYSELLARVVGPQGHVIAHNHPGARTALPAAGFEQRYGHERLPNVEQLFVRHNDIRLSASSIDAVLMSMVFHDFYWYDAKVDWGPVDVHALLVELYGALTPGGIVGVIDHYAVAGLPPAESAKATHRIDRAIVERDFRAAGFELVATSDLLRNPADDRTRSVFDAAVHGKTDRFLLRFRKP